VTETDDWKSRIAWPSEGYRDPDTGELHPWTDQVPDDPDGGTAPAGTFMGDDQPYTYQDMVGDQAEAAHMDVEEFLTSMRYDRTGGVFDEKLSPPWIDDGDGFGE
jgi:hypothetical protein